MPSEPDKVRLARASTHGFLDELLDCKAERRPFDVTRARANAALYVHREVRQDAYWKGRRRKDS
jgi:hypothetical protein